MALEPKKKLSATEAKLVEIHERLRTWSHFVRELKVPSEIAPAFTTGRFQLIAFATPRALTVDECREMYALVGGLLETNEALKEHAAAVADLAMTQHQAARGMVASMDRMRQYANFHNPNDDTTEEA